MVKGIIKNNKPLISIVVAWHLGVQELVALIDTGFTGELKISPDKAKELGLEVTHTEPVSLGNEQTVNMPASLARVSLEGIKTMVNVLLTPGETIIGIGLLKQFGYILTMNCKEDFLTLQRA